MRGSGKGYVRGIAGRITRPFLSHLRGGSSNLTVRGRGRGTSSYTIREDTHERGGSSNFTVRGRGRGTSSYTIKEDTHENISIQGLNNTIITNKLPLTDTPVENNEGKREATIDVPPKTEIITGSVVSGGIEAEATPVELISPPFIAARQLWKLWKYDKKRVQPVQLLSYRDRLERVGFIISVPGLLKHLVTVKVDSLKFSSGCSYCFFKNKIEPVWEHPANIEGGRFVMEFNFQSTTLPEIDTVWQELLVELVEKKFGDNMSYICGVKVRCKNLENHKISMWTTEDVYKDQTIFNGIRGRLKGIGSKIPGFEFIIYQIHSMRNNFGPETSV